MAEIQSIQIGRKLLNFEEVNSWYESKANLTECLVNNLHTTIAYSRKLVDWSKPTFKPKDDTVIIKSKFRTIRILDGNTVTLEFESNQFTERWQECISAGASWDYSEYIPHITLLRPSTNLDVEPYPNELIFGEEYRKLVRF